MLTRPQRDTRQNYRMPSLARHPFSTSVCWVSVRMHTLRPLFPGEMNSSRRRRVCPSATPQAAADPHHLQHGDNSIVARGVAHCFGAGKADAIKLATSGASAKDAPAGAACGINRSLVLCDQDAAAQIR